MLTYYTVEQLYNETDIDEIFLKSFDVLSDSVKEIILKRNYALQIYLRQVKETDYQKLDFTKERIEVQKLFINIKDINDSLCPIDGENLQKKSIVLKMETKNFGIILEVCPRCKKIYMYKGDEKLEKICKTSYPYEIITKEEKHYENE